MRHYLRLVNRLVLTPDVRFLELPRRVGPGHSAALVPLTPLACHGRKESVTPLLSTGRRIDLRCPIARRPAPSLPYSACIELGCVLGPKVARKLRWRTGFHGKFMPVYLFNKWIGNPTGKRASLFFQKRCIVALRVYQPG